MQRYNSLKSSAAEDKYYYGVTAAAVNQSLNYLKVALFLDRSWRYDSEMHLPTFTLWRKIGSEFYDSLHFHESNDYLSQTSYLFYYYYRSD